MTLPYKLLAVAGLLVAAWGWHAWDKDQAERAAYAAGQADTQQRWDQERIEQQALALLAEQRARAEEQAKVKAAQEAMNAHRKQAAQARADAAAAGDALRELRDALAARDAAARGGEAGADTAAGPCVDVGATERELLRSCAAEYQALAADADGVRARLLGLQEWVRGVCVSPSASAPGR